jgi:hypothetical protein
MSRSEEEYNLFKKMDEERFRERERRKAAGEVVLPEMVGKEELPAWLTAPPPPVEPEKARFKDIEGTVNESFGRGKRRKTEVDYSDQLDEDEFCMLMERGATEDEIRAYVTERNARNGGAREQQEGGADDDGDEDHADDGAGGEGPLLPDDVAPKRRSTKAAPRPLEQHELALQTSGLSLLEAMRSLKEATTGRCFADKWRLLWGPDGPPERKRGRPVTSDKPIDLTDFGNKLKKLRYKRVDQMVSDLERMFTHLLTTLPADSSDRAEALEGLKKLHEVGDQLMEPDRAKHEEEEELAAAAILAGGGDVGQQPIKKLKLRLTLDAGSPNEK